MTNHVHLIAKAKENYSLSEILRDFKKFTRKAIFKVISENSIESRREMLLKHFATIRASGVIAKSF
jgi:REP element-mobilizing transposase RayT